MSTLRLVEIARDFSDGRQLRRVLFPTDLEFIPGELTVLSGPSGSGKTTLLSIMGLVLRPSEGRMFLDALDVTSLSDEESASVRLRQYGFVFQQPMLIEGLSVTAGAGSCPHRPGARMLLLEGHSGNGGWVGQGSDRFQCSRDPGCPRVNTAVTYCNISI